jgi:hypothetical protein
MPVHDWTRVDAGLFHSFHQRWIGALCDALNAGGLPPDYFALAEQSIRGPIPDVLSSRLPPGKEPPHGTAPAVAVAVAPPRARLIRSAEGGVYARKADRVTVRHRHGQIVAVVEIVSPGNKGSNSELRAFVEKTADLIQQGVHVLVIDLFPPHPARPARAAQGDLGRVRGRRVHAPARQTPDARRLLRRGDQDGLRRADRRGRRAARHAVVPRAGGLRAGAARGYVPDDLERVPRRVEGVA